MITSLIIHKAHVERVLRTRKALRLPPLTDRAYIPNRRDPRGRFMKEEI